MAWARATFGAQPAEGDVPSVATLAALAGDHS